MEQWLRECQLEAYCKSLEELGATRIKHLHDVDDELLSSIHMKVRVFRSAAQCPPLPRAGF
jgi:hypothetical protein